MNSLVLRDKLLADLHAAIFKPQGYKKKGHWITRDLGNLTHSYYLRASRFGNSEHAIFWIDVQVFSEPWHQLVFPERPYKGPSEGPSLFSRELGSWCSPPQLKHEITPNTDVATLTTCLVRAAEHGAIPLLSTFETPEALLRQLVVLSGSEFDLSVVGLSKLLGYEEQAREFMERAKRNAVHENDLRFLELRERNIWRNAA